MFKKKVFTFSVRASRSSSAATKEGEMTWFQGDNEIDNEDIVSKVDYTTSQLRIEKASLSDAGRYNCKFENDDGYKSEDYFDLYVYGKWLGHTHLPIEQKSLV